MKTLAEQLRSAAHDKGLPIAKLLEESKLKCTRSSLSRKLAGKQILATKDAERLADVLDVTLVWAPKSQRQAA